ncbi:uncharacterized protein KZ484_013084 [Pholidichthys leucotaenia]
MDQRKITGKGVPPSKTTLRGNHESQTKGQRITPKRPDSPPSSSVSMKSDESMFRPVGFKEKHQHDSQKITPKRPDSPPSSSVSMKSDGSMFRPVGFKDKHKYDSQKITPKRPDSPPSSSVSMKSDGSMFRPVGFKDKHKYDSQKITPKRPDSPPSSSVSMKSDDSMFRPVGFKDKHQYDSQRIHEEIPDSPPPTSVSMKSDNSIFRPTFFKGKHKPDKKIDQILPNSPPPTSVSMKSDHSIFRPVVFKDKHKGKQKSDSHGNEDELADHLQRRASVPQREIAKCKEKLMSNLKKKFQHVYEGIAKAGSPTLLNKIYTELYITEGGTAEVNDEHEVRQIETASRKPYRPETTIRQEDIFKGRGGTVRTILTKGVAGIGKTILMQKFTLDWAEGKANQDIQFAFPFTFRELNVLKEKKFSLVELIHHFFTETKEAGIRRFEQLQVVLIFDGLDECRLPLDFHNTESLTDVTESTSVDVLLTNLIRGKLLPSAHLWITTRPAAANQIPPQYVNIITEVRGFTDLQKEKYFRKRFKNEELANRIINHIQVSRSLHIMCHIPVFCWITATVLEDVLKTREGGGMPKTLTEMYIHFLVVQAKVKKVKYEGGVETDQHWSPDSKKMVESLGKLAFEQLQKGNLIFYESDLKQCGIDTRAASLYSGVFTQIFKEERGLYQDTVFCFVHLSIQEFLAALHVHLTFFTSGVNLLEANQATSKKSETSESAEIHFYQSAVNKALQSPNGDLDLFLRFLMGLSRQTNQALLRGLLTPQSSSSQTNQKTVKYIKKKINENLSAERSINLFHCLNELNDRSLMKEIQQALRTGRLSTDELSYSQWSALVFFLLSSEKDLDVFDLKKYSASEVAFLRLLPVVKICKKALLDGCNLSERSCEALSEVLSSSSSSLKELDLSNNDLKDAGVKTLSSGLQSPHCKLEILRLSGCNLSERNCEDLAEVLSCQSSNLRELDLSNNDLKDSGVKRLSSGLASPHCKLETLSLSGCMVTKEGCASLASALSSNPSCLKELDLSYNHPGELGLKLLSAQQEDPQYTLETVSGSRWGGPSSKGWIHSSFTCSLSRSSVPVVDGTEIEVDINTINQNLQLSNNKKKVTVVDEEQGYPYRSERFNPCTQLLCTSGLTGRCYWEVECIGDVNVAVAYKITGRKGCNCQFGMDHLSWNLYCSEDCYHVTHENERVDLPRPSSSSTVSHRVGVYVDCPAGVLSFYRVMSNKLVHLYTFNTTFKKPLFPGFRLCTTGSTVTLS